MTPYNGRGEGDYKAGRRARSADAGCAFERLLCRLFAVAVSSRSLSPKGHARACVRVLCVRDGETRAGRSPAASSLSPDGCSPHPCLLAARSVCGVRVVFLILELVSVFIFFFLFFLPFGSVPPGLISLAPCLTASDPGHQPRPRLPPSPGSAPWPRRVGSFAQWVSVRSVAAPASVCSGSTTLRFL